MELTISVDCFTIEFMELYKTARKMGADFDCEDLAAEADCIWEIARRLSRSFRQQGGYKAFFTKQSEKNSQSVAQGET
jgi:hypothetical protein